MRELLGGLLTGNLAALRGLLKGLSGGALKRKYRGSYGALKGL